MNLLAARLIGDQFGEEAGKLLAGVPRGGFSHSTAPLRVLSAALQSPRRQRQHRFEPIQGLDGGLFVDAKHRRMFGRLERTSQ
jgi:hypothetical protein